MESRCAVPENAFIGSGDSLAATATKSLEKDDKRVNHCPSPGMIQERQSCPGSECCGNVSAGSSQAASQASGTNPLEKPCCGSISEAPATGASQNFASGCGEKSVCVGRSVDIAPKIGETEYSKGCCKAQPTVSSAEIFEHASSDCSEGSCCGDAVGPVFETIHSDTNLPPNTCCTTKAKRYSTERNIPVTTLDSIESLSSTSSTAAESRNEYMDLEQGASETDHFLLNVQGMTCTGCEKKLHRALNSIPAVSNLKTSLVLAQAAFDLSQSSYSDSSSFVKSLEAMTGFTITLLSQPGENLELALIGNVGEYGWTENMPRGVVDVSMMDSDNIRVTYNPKVIGGRDMISDPFFRFAKLAPIAPPPVIASGRAHVRQSFLLTLLSSLLTIPVLVLAWAPLPEHKITYGAISLGLATIVQTAIARPFYVSALKALLFARMIEMDLLIVISTSTAYIYSVAAFAYLVAGRPLSTGQFFETSTLLVTLIMVGRTVSAFARHKAIESISIESLQTPTALLVDPKSQIEQEIDARILQYGDIFRVLPECSIVTDGVVIKGQTEIDESMVTGEATLVYKEPGSHVLAGSINHSGTITVRLTHLPGENTITTIGAMVDEAQSSKPRIQEMADQVAGYFVPVMLVLTLLVFVTWVPIGLRHQDTATACINAMTYAISALIIACPCAIGLAVPMVVVIAGGVGARHGLIFKSAETLRIARKITHVVLDKTGTLTTGKFSVVVEEDLSEDYGSVLAIILGLTTNSKHPVSVAIVDHLKAKGIEASPIDSVVSIPGCGVEATSRGIKIRAGSPYWLGVSNTVVVRGLLSKGLTAFCVSMNGDFVAAFGLQDGLRHDALATIRQLEQRSIEISIISGDHEEAVLSIARELAIPETNTRSRCSPGDKQAYIKEALAMKNAVVLFCGDGTNDAVALSQASIGMHMNEGTDIAQSAADAVLMRPSLHGIVVLMKISEAFYRRVVFNFIWAFVYNLFAFLLASGAFPHARISPQYAGLGEIVSVLPVILVAIQLRWVRF